MSATVAYLGPEGTFTHEAALRLFSHDAELIPYPSIPDTLSAVTSMTCDNGVVPVENAIEGSVNLTLDWLIHHVELPIVGELAYPIKQHLLVHPTWADQPWTDIQQVISHPQAVAQCRLFLKKRLPQAELVYANSTAEAAERVSNHPDHPWAAIGTQTAGNRYGLKVQSSGVEDHANNYTRFIVLGKPLTKVPLNLRLQKTSLLITLATDFPGALYQVLAVFAWRKINLSRIESRPTKKGLGSYHFVIDAEKELEHVLMTGAINEIRALGCQVRLLGSYPCFALPSSETQQERNEMKK